LFAPPSRWAGKGSSMTTQKQSDSLDKFGLPLESDIRPHPTTHGMDRWVPIRDLHARHRARILDHLLQLDSTDRYLRFGFHAPQEQVSRYVASIDFKRDEVFGIFNQRLQLVAMAHLAAMPGLGPNGDSSRGRAMEFGVSVLPQGRGKGLGMRLFEHAITHARNQGASHLMIHALSENAPMLRIATKAGAKVERDGEEAEAWLKLPPDTVVSHLDSSMNSLAADVIYGIKYQALHTGDWLRMLIASA
jgi:GNAT superfamily N-acetyltransferase